MKEHLYARPKTNNECGIALPMALLLMMVVTALTAIFSKITIETLNIIKQDEANLDTFDTAEGGVHDVIRQMVLNPHLWREKVPLSATPSGYTQYAPATYAATNGIPTCAGLSCERSLYPTGGGIIKNYGPIGGAGDDVDTAYSIADQLNPDALPAADLVINNEMTWVQVERLDEALPNSQVLGGDLSNNSQGGGNANIVRFRVTGTSLRKVKESSAQATVVVIIEVPNA